MSYICVLDDWEIEKDHLTILDKKLGGGYFGVVKKGIYKEKENESLVVAVKMLKGLYISCRLFIREFKLRVQTSNDRHT